MATWPSALGRLDALADGCSFVLGHNFIHFDRPHLAAAQPGLRLLALPVIDTLWLNPLAFPRHPYHHLVKHYQDGGLRRGQLNDPLLDAQLTLDLFHDQYQALQQRQQEAPELLLAWHWLTTLDERVAGLNSFFTTLRRQLRPSDAAARQAIARLLDGKGCRTQAMQVVDDAAQSNWSLAYALAWLSVAGGNSVLPPWVRHQFPGAGVLIRRLRDQACGQPDCAWCSEHHDASRELARWFGFTGFRPEPAGADGRPLQQSIVEAALRGEHLLAILPTGTGKSLCYQIPALSRFEKTGALTVVISPLVALMADQVAGLRARGIDSCLAINGLLSMPERADALDRVRLGDAGILIISPEQLRNSDAAQGARAARDRRLGARRGALPVEVGTRFSSRLPLCRALHPREGRRRSGAAGAVPDRDRQTRRRRRHRRPLCRKGRRRPALLRRRRQPQQPRLRGVADDAGRKAGAHPPAAGGRTAG
ncbi:MAG: DEAD/DEAH box helicase [Candidatus Accumulibacter necessarius]